MNKSFSYIEFYNELISDLATSYVAQRKVWAFVILNNDIDLRSLSKLLYSDKKIALRYAWLLTEIGKLDPNKLGIELPYLLKQSEQINHFDFIQSFATYWLISGVPLENEPIAIDLLFQWVASNQINTTTKSRAVKVLVNLTKKYPDLKNELLISLSDQN